MGVLGFQSHDACGGNVRGLMFNISAEQRYGAENTTANCRIIDLFLHLNRDWSPRFSTLRLKNGWVRAKTA
jgi:hypothetical protein